VLLGAVAATPPVDGLGEIVASPLVSSHPETVTESDRARVRSLLDRAPATWPLAPFAANVLLADAESREDFDDCVELATRYADRLPPGSLRAALLVDAEGCALKTSPPRPDVHRALLERSETLVEDPSAPILPFDRAWRYAQIHRAREHLGDAAGMARVGERWLSFLRHEQARADGPERATLAASLQFALETLGDRPAALDVLVDAVRAAPDNAEALLRYATALDDAGRLDDAIGALARGATRIPPPRRLPVLWQEAELLGKKNDVPGEVAVLDASVALFAVTPAAPHYDSVRKKIDARRAELARR
jgi:tetratricopeptide (TPR) repeat protein